MGHLSLDVVVCCGWGWAQGRESVGTGSGRGLFLDPLTLLLGTFGGSADLKWRL